MRDFKTLWSDFKKEFVNQIKLQSEKGLTEAWFNRTNRTNFYVKEIFPLVAKNMDLVLTKELFKVDAAMAMKSQPDNWEIPIIFIESENVISSALEEVDKLCSLSAPVRVLITIGDKKDPDTKAKIDEWASLIKAYSKIWSNKGIIGIIIADYQLNFISMAWGENGEQIEEEHIYSHDLK